MTAPLRALLVEDHPIYRDGLVAALERGVPGLQCQGVGSCAQALEALAIGPALDAVLADFKLPDGDGLTLLADVRRRWPTLACVLVSGSEDPRVIEQAQAMRLMAFVPKSLEPDRLVSVLARVLAGETCFPTVAASTGPVVRFTERQSTVLQAVAQGRTSRAIAQMLGITERTVKAHLAVIFGRLDASTRAEAVARAAALGLIDLQQSS